MNARMRTKPVVRLEEKLHIYVKNTISSIMPDCGNAGMYGRSIEVPFGETVEWVEKPTFSNPHWTKVTFYGYTRFEEAFARYEGEYGIWEIGLALFGGPPANDEIARRRPCVRTWGRAKCYTPSNEWRETKEERHTRLVKLIDDGIL